jgi:demethylmenaquinone methyltransferase/2-methoxy-6-polyprenyl-1,4-benzoquinol methylase
MIKERHRPTAEALQRLYQRVASSYDAALWGYALVGFQHRRYRRRAIEALRLPEGSTVVDIGCGTGLNFALLQEAIGPTGRIIGVDLTPAMLDAARRRADRYGWTNITLVAHDAVSFDYPQGIDGVLATFSLSMMPGYRTVVHRAVQALRCDARLSVLDFRIPTWWPVWLQRLALALTRPLGETKAMAQRPVWQAVEEELEQTKLETYYFGAAYIAHGIRPSEDEQARGAPAEKRWDGQDEITYAT